MSSWNRVGLLVSCSILALSPDTLATSTRVTIEATDLYCDGVSSPCKCNADSSCCNLCTEQTNVQGLRDTLVGTGQYTTGNNFFNSNAWDSDFIDPERDSRGDDTHNFDRAGDAIAMFSGHGSCDDTSKHFCSHTSDCTSPGPGQSMPGACITEGPNMWPPGVCAYSTPRHIVVNGSSHPFGNWVDYSSGDVRFGESSNSGSWGGAGTNGGVNFVILDASCPLRPPFYQQELVPAFAGVHQIATIMPVSINGWLNWGSSDTSANDGDRGRFFAALFIVNANSSIAMDWVNTLNSMGQSTGSACPNMDSNYTYGGGHGINGCGSYAVCSVDSSDWRVLGKIYNEDWSGNRDDSNDANGASSYYCAVVSNFDSNTYPFVIQ